ncbi:MAG: hypothetical protein M5U26_01085 [Planctomycetota bacterium]|nr:hypothetical protein [Planctomycetota bacterium]
MAAADQSVQRGRAFAAGLAKASPARTTFASPAGSLASRARTPARIAAGAGFRGSARSASAWARRSSYSARAPGSA